MDLGFDLFYIRTRITRMCYPENLVLSSFVLCFFLCVGLALKQVPRLTSGSVISVLCNGLQIAGSERLLQEEPIDSIYESYLHSPSQNENGI
jgi:hypothetical protein